MYVLSLIIDDEKFDTTNVNATDVMTIMN